MKKMTISLATAALLSACGGGGGGGGSSVPAGPAAPISAANQTAVAQDALQTSSLLFEGTGQATIVAAAQLDERMLMKVARDQRAKLADYFAHAPQGAAGAVQSQQFACSVSGVLTVTVNDADNDSLPSAGDSVSLTFSNCSDGNGVVNGGLGIAINAMSGANSQLTMNFGRLSVSAAGFNASANGTVTIAMTYNSASDYSQLISVPSLNMTASYAGVVRGRSLSNYNASFIHAASQDSYAVSGTVRGWNSLASVEVEVATPTTFVRLANDLYPSVGQLVLTGMNNSKLRVTAIDNANAAVEVDEDGDGLYEIGPKTVAWSILLN